MKIGGSYSVSIKPRLRAHWKPKANPRSFSGQAKLKRIAITESLYRLNKVSRRNDAWSRYAK
jgi:hypothetical protein